MHSDQILFQYQTTPSNIEGIISKLDGQVIDNNTTKNAFDLSLGEHKYTVEKDGEILAERNFSITTNLSDQRKLVDKLYQLGHIKSYSVALSIKTQLLLAEIAEQFKLFRLRDLLIQSTINFIIQQNKQKKPLINDYAKIILISDLNHLLTR